jgi:VWFA-related protein
MVAAPMLPQQQKQQTAEPEEPVIKVDVDIVNVLCSVRDKNGRLIPNLTKDDFEIFEEGKLQEIRYFTKETDLPLTIGLLVDVSKSQESLIDIEKQAAYRFFSDVLRPKDLAFVISFGSDAELLQDLTHSTQALRKGLDDLRVSSAVGGLHPGPVPTGKPRGTILYDAVFLASEDRLRREVGRKAIVVISDGVDMGSRISKSEAIEAAHKSDAVIYSIYYADPYYQYLADGFGDLKKMSEETGGRVLRVNKKNPLDLIFKDIQEEMRSQYSIGYISNNADNGTPYRKIEIRPKEKSLKVQARKGYYVNRT